MQFKKILILGKEEILLSGLFIRLQDQGKLVIHQFDSTDTDDIIAEIIKVEPEVILMDDTFNSVITELLINFPDDRNIHLIIINPKENKIQILDTQRIEVNTIEDFINVL